MIMRKFDNQEERLDYIEFRQTLLFDNDDVSRLLFEYEITHNEYVAIMDLMDKYRTAIDNQQDISSARFETEMYNILSKEHYGDYHFCEYITRAFMKCGRWEEVFWALYGDNPKYKGLRVN